MKVFVCIKVAESGESEPLVETRVVFTEGEACKALAELEGFEIGPGDGYSSDPSEFAEQLGSDDRAFYVEEHELDFVAAACNALKARLAEDMAGIDWNSSQRFHTGGFVKGQGLHADDIPAIVRRPGERLMTIEDVEKLARDGLPSAQVMLDVLKRSTSTSADAAGIDTAKR